MTSAVQEITPFVRRSARVVSLRHAALLAHRYVGLFITLFLVVAGATGSVIAFYPELDEWMNPELTTAQPPFPGAQRLDPIELRERLAQQLPSGQSVNSVLLSVEGQRSLSFWFKGKEVFVDPYTGGVLGTRVFGDLGEGRKGVLSFLYRLHYSLGLKDVGMWLFGVAALLWTLDCFVGAYLTFPAGVAPAAGGPARLSSWFARWLPAWLLRARRSFALVFTWHRASGLWLWGLLLVFAWSAVGLNLHEQVYTPVMNRVFGPDEDIEARLPRLDPPRAEPALGWRAALDAGRRLMSEAARERGFQILGERQLDYSAEHGTYSYTVESTRDVAARLADTSVHFDATDGRLLAFHAPTGENRQRTVTSYLMGLHFGALRAGGIVYRLLVSLLGLLVTLLSVTGVWIWWRKREGRGSNRERRRQRSQAYAP